MNAPLKQSHSFAKTWQQKPLLGYALHLNHLKRRAFFAVSAPLVVLAVAWGLAFMPQKGTGWTVRFDVGLAWLAALSIFVLVPTDVAASLQV